MKGKDKGKGGKKGGKKGKRTLGLAATVLLAAGAASAQEAQRGLIHDGTIDLRVITLGKVMTLPDAGFVSLGFRIKPDDYSGIDLEPTGISLLKAGCSWGLPRSLLMLQCGE